MTRVRRILGPDYVGRLPTVWSNCLVGWWLGGGGEPWSLGLLLAGTTLLFLGGAFLKDAFDADPEHAPAAVSRFPRERTNANSAWRWSLGLLTVGALLLMRLGVLPGSLGLTLVFFIVAYDFAHSVAVIAPLLEGACRFFVYILAASVAQQGVTGWAIWCGLATGIYVAGAGYFQTRTPQRSPYWPLLLVTSPIFLALLMDTGPFREPSLLLAGLLILWLLLSLRPVFWPSEPNRPRSARELLAGIVLADWLAACPAPAFLGAINHSAREISFAFIALFILCVLLERASREP